MKIIRFAFALLILLIGIFSTLNCKVIDSVVKKRSGKIEKNRINTKNNKINQIWEEGLQANQEKNYDLAIEKFEEGYQIEPTSPDIAPAFLNNKALVLMARGTDTYNKSIKSDTDAKDAAKESAKKDFVEAVNSSETALDILKTANPIDEDVQNYYQIHTLLAFTNRKNSYRLMAQTGADRTKGKRALIVFQEYLAVETDPVRKSKAQFDLALTLQDSDEPELAVVEFQKILTIDPDDVDALAGIGLNLVNIGYLNGDKEKLKEAEKYLRHYVKIAPDSHKFKQEALSIIESLQEPEKTSGESKNGARNKGLSKGKVNSYITAKTE